MARKKDPLEDMKPRERAEHIIGMAKKGNIDGETHNLYLERLQKYHNLRAIGINPYEVRWVISKYQLFNCNKDSEKYPDLFILLKNRNWEIVELKKSRKRRGRALEQIDYGMEFLEEALGVLPQNCMGRFVMYNVGIGYSSETYRVDPNIEGKRRLVRVE